MFYPFHAITQNNLNRIMLNTEYLTRCIETLEKSCACIKKAQEGSVDYEMFRNSLVKSFERTLEQSGKLLRKYLAPYYASKKIVDGFTFKDLFREAHKHSLNLYFAQSNSLLELALPVCKQQLLNIHKACESAINYIADQLKLKNQQILQTRTFFFQRAATSLLQSKPHS